MESGNGMKDSIEFELNKKRIFVEFRGIEKSTEMTALSALSSPFFLHSL